MTNDMLARRAKESGHNLGRAEVLEGSRKDDFLIQIKKILSILTDDSDIMGY